MRTPDRTWSQAWTVISPLIDGLTRRRDERTYRQRYTPRRARSNWSQSNIDRVTRLIADGRMQPAGLAEVERAKADGRWDAGRRSQ